MLRQEKTQLKKKISLYVDNINIHSYNHIIHFNNKSRNIYLPVLVVEEKNMEEGESLCSVCSQNVSHVLRRMPTA